MTVVLDNGLWIQRTVPSGACASWRRTVGLSGVRRARNIACDVVDVSSDVFILGARQGRTRKIVAALMGHAKVGTTLNIYTQVLDASVRTAVAKVGDELFTIVHRPAGTTELIH